MPDQTFRLPTFRTSMLALLLMVLLAAAGGASPLAASPPDRSPAAAPPVGEGLSNTLGTQNDADIWWKVSDGVQGYVSIPNKQAGVLVERNGEQWRLWQTGPIAIVGAIAFWTMFVVVVGFYLIRGKVRIQSGRSGRKILRFTFIERFAHWLTAGSFVILAITGVNLMYGRYVLAPIIGLDTFSTLTRLGKYAHNYVGFAFIIGLVMIFVLWVRDNIWDRYDWRWIREGGGLIFPSKHPPAGKFNFGQKTVFWMVMGGGAILAVTGINLLFPFRFATLEQMQWIAAIHATLSQVMCLLMVAHIYIGTVGMQDAFHAMSTGYVDVNWAREHHRGWLEDVVEKGKSEPAGSGTLTPPRQAPAE